MTASGADKQAGGRLDYDGVVRVTGSIAAWKISAILALNPTEEELDRAVAWVSVESGGGLRHESGDEPVTDGRVAGIYEILVSDRADPEE